MISYMLVYHPKPLGPIRELYTLFMTDKETPVAAILFFKMRPKIFPSYEGPGEIEINNHREY